MPIEWELITPEIESKKEKIFVNEYWVIVFESLLWELKSIYDYLNLNQEERRMVEWLKKEWYTLIWEKIINEPYPEYIKTFIEENFSIIIDGNEANYEREWNNSQLVFIKITLPESKKIAPEVQEEVMDLKAWIQRILANMWDWK